MLDNRAAWPIIPYRGSMSEEQKERAPLDIPAEAEEQAKKLIGDAFNLFAEHARNVADDLAAFNRRRQEVRGRIERGARRTSGRIV